MKNSVTAIIGSIKKIKRFRFDKELAEYLEVHQSAITNWRARNVAPRYLYLLHNELVRNKTDDPSGRYEFYLSANQKARRFDKHTGHLQQYDERKHIWKTID